MDEEAMQLLIRMLIYQSYAEYNRLSDLNQALDLSREGIARFPNSFDMQAVRAYALQVIGRPDEANRIALRIIDRSPEHVLARVVLSLSYGSQGIFEAALREGNVAVELADQHGRFQMESYRTRAFAHANLAQYDEAIADIDHAITLNRKLIPLHFERASYAIQLGDIDQATVSYFHIMAFDEDNIKARFRMCELSGSLQDVDLAMRYCGEVTTYAPDWADGWYQLGREFFLQGDFVNALASFNQCSTLQVQQQVPIAERQLECWYLQGQSAEILGNCQALMATYREFLDMVARGNLPQTWSYPPEGPSICAGLPPTVTAVYTLP
jgi:tetratricopeptide (TPR) repeat protein